MTPLQYYLIGTYFAGILLIFRGFNKEYIDSMNELIEKGPPRNFMSLVLFVAYFILIMFSWLTVVGFTLKRIKEWLDE